MGLFKMSASVVDRCASPRMVVEVRRERVDPPNPDPWVFQIGPYEQVGGNLVVILTYPNCTTYEGRKLLVFADTSIETLRRATYIDPHFSQAIAPNTCVPVARFEPTRRGWALAKSAAEEL